MTIKRYFIFSAFGGFFAGRLYKSLKGQLWKRAAVQTALLYPGVCLAVAFLLNFFIWGKHSSGAVCPTLVTSVFSLIFWDFHLSFVLIQVPFSTMVAVLAMWFGISLPLVMIGFYFGYRKQPYENPVRTNQIPRQVPQQLWYMNPIIR